MKTARSEREIARVREKILEGALDIIIKQGFDALTMRYLARRIGMTAPNIYNYFANKDELYISIVIRGFEMLHNDLSQAYHRHDDDIQRVRAMIETYMEFGMNKPRYYDIMFSRPTPKYNDYVGTPFEELSEVEYRLSMNIAELALKATSRLMGDNMSEETIQKRIIHIWSLLHGMISLYNSHIVSYVAEKAEDIYSKLIEEFIEGLLHPNTHPQTNR